MPERIQWEYASFLIQGNVEEELTKIGADGWEAWAVIQHVQEPDGTVKWAVACKRQKQLIMVSKLH